MAESNKIKLPYNGKVWHPKNQTSDILFIFVHHYGGNSRSVKRHIYYINELGFRAVSFNLGGAHNQKMYLPPIARKFKWGLRSIWADRIEDILNIFSDEQKVIFSLSNPSYSVLDAIYRTKANNLKAAIFDGGPFFDATRCYWNLFTNAFPKPFLSRMIHILWGMIYWNILFYKKRANRFLKSFQNNLNILSIRAEKDSLVPVEAIDAVFKNYPKENLTQVLLKNEKHLLGLKNQPETYKEIIHSFLKKEKIT